MKTDVIVEYNGQKIWHSMQSFDVMYNAGFLEPLSRYNESGELLGTVWTFDLD